MSFEKRLITLFKGFVEKVFIPQCNKNEAAMSDWNKFIGLLSNENININEIQLYVDNVGMNNQVNPLLMQSQQSVPTVGKKEQFYNHSSVYNRKKQENLSFENPQQMNFNPNKTFGGEKIKMPMYNNKQEFDQMARKQFTNSLNPTTKEDLNKFRTTTTPTMGNNAYKQTNVDNAPVMLASLEKLYKSLVENQQKIESLTQVSSQMVGATLGNQAYF